MILPDDYSRCGGWNSDSSKECTLKHKCLRYLAGKSDVEKKEGGGIKLLSWTLPQEVGEDCNSFLGSRNA